MLHLLVKQLIWLHFLPLALAIDPPRRPYPPTGSDDGRLITFNETTSSEPVIVPSRVSIRWVPSPTDGQHVTINENGDLVLEEIVSEKSKVLLTAQQIPQGQENYWIRSDMAAVLFSINTTRLYRYSYFSDYFIVNVSSGEMSPLVGDQAGDIQYATFSPAGDSIAFVRGNNLYLRDGDGSIHQITTNGGPDVFNGVPDWVYEEEVFGEPSALWFSPDGKNIAFLSFNETGVGTFPVAYYMDGNQVPPYPRELQLRYPKVGTINPTAQLSLLDVDTKIVQAIEIDAFEPNNTIIGEISWATDHHAALICRVFNRVQDQEKYILINQENQTSSLIRYRNGTDGWLENSMSIFYVGALESSKENETFYVDLSDESGWMHIYLYPVNGGEGIQLTSGDSEVTRIIHVDRKRNIIYYSSTRRHSTERHIYHVSYATKEVLPLVDDTFSAYWAASFSPGGSYYVLNYNGPDVPYQELYSIHDCEPLRTITSNADIYEKLNQYKLPNITYFELEHPEGFSLNVMRQLPPDFDPDKKYPALFTPYGGPNSQSVSKSFRAPGWTTYISSEPELQFITYTVDNRGTGFKGRKFRSVVTKRLGDFETQDQIWAARELISRDPFINPNKVGMWGWSFGGYVTAKIVEANSGVFTFGLSTAPVTDWRLYDSIYTERYMKMPHLNEQGYNETAVSQASGFKNLAGAFSLMHGTGDDNVHYQNTAALADLLVRNGVSPGKFKMMAYTDNNHNINSRGARISLYRFLTARLWDEVIRNPEKDKTHQWSRKGTPRR